MARLIFADFAVGGYALYGLAIQIRAQYDGHYKALFDTYSDHIEGYGVDKEILKVIRPPPDHMSTGREST